MGFEVMGPSLDLVISGALVFDGTGRMPFLADVGVRGDRIVAIGKLDGAAAARREDASGLCLCPGFVDIHSHADMSVIRSDHGRLLEPLARQGVTTFVGGNCGVGMAPAPDGPNLTHLHSFWDFFLGGPQTVTWTTFGGMLDVIERQGVLLNVAVLAPFNVIRMGVCGGKASATEEERRRIRQAVAEAMESGAVGLSFGLQYFPGLLCETPELIDVARIARKYNGFVAAHLRSYNSDTLGKAIAELLEIGVRAEVPVQASHLFVIPNLPGRLNRLASGALRLAAQVHRRFAFRAPQLGYLLYSYLDQALRAAEAAGQEFGVDAMPTSAGFTHVLAFMPPWCIRGGVRAALDVLADPARREEVRRSIEEGDTSWPHREGDSWSMNLFKVLGYDCIHIMSLGSGRDDGMLGHSVAELAKRARKDPFDWVCDLLIEEKGRVLAFLTPTFPGDELAEQSLEPVLTHPRVAIATDSILLGFGMPSHLFYDCYPKFLSHYARDLRLISLSQAIRKCTSLPADQARLFDRGRIREGACADLVLFDLDRLRTNSTAQRPGQFPDGIESVFVNGTPLVEHGQFHSDARPGCVIRRGR